MKYLNGDLFVTLTEMKSIKASNGKIYAKTIILPDQIDAKQMIEGIIHAYLRTEYLNARPNLKFATVMSVSIAVAPIYHK